MEAALRESEERFRLTFDEAPVGAAIVSPDFRFIAVNATLCRITGYSAEELTGVDFGKITHPDDNAADIKKAQQLLLGAINQYDMEKRYIHRNGGEAWIHLWVKLLRDKAGRPLYFLPIMEDITERKKAEEELRQSQVKLQDLHRQLQNAREEERRRISREIHDELGQNVTAMQIDLAWLKKKIDPAQPALLAKLDAMSRVAESTLATVRRVSAELRPGILDVLGLSAAVDWLVRDFEKRNEIQGTLHIEPEEIDVEPNLATDVFRVLQETLTNISRHAQASMVWVTLRQTPDEIHLNVIDNGIGISAEQHLQSVSLGFLGIRERLLSWGGTLSVQGLPGEGTSIRVSIPTEGKGGLV
jgi:two-component system sensor histidine kinase UhpB